MPHIVLENISEIKEAFEAVQSFAKKIDGGMLKVIEQLFNSLKTITSL